MLVKEGTFHKQFFNVEVTSIATFLIVREYHEFCLGKI